MIEVLVELYLGFGVDCFVYGVEQLQGGEVVFGWEGGVELGYECVDQCGSCVVDCYFVVFDDFEVMFVVWCVWCFFVDDLCEVV